MYCDLCLKVVKSSLILSWMKISFDFNIKHFFLLLGEIQSILRGKYESYCNWYESFWSCYARISCVHACLLEYHAGASWMLKGHLACIFSSYIQITIHASLKITLLYHLEAHRPITYAHEIMPLTSIHASEK